MKHIKIVTAVIMTFHFSSATSEVSNSIQNSLMDLSGLSAITNTPKLETTKERNQFFDNYSVLSIPDINIVDQVQLQNIQTFAPSHRRISLDGLNKIKGIKIQNGKITVSDMTSKSQGVKDIVEVVNAVLQEVKSLNQKELNSLRLTITDMKNMPIIQQQFEEMERKGKEITTLWPKLTFADFDQMANAGVSTSGKLTLPNYNKTTASDNLNRFIEISNQISNQISKYADTRSLPTTAPFLADTILIPVSLEDSITSVTIVNAPRLPPEAVPITPWQPYEPITLTPLVPAPERDFSKILPISDEMRRLLVVDPLKDIHYKEIDLDPIFFVPFPTPIFPGPVPIPVPVPIPGPCAYCGVPEFPNPPIPITISVPDSNFDYMPGARIGTFEPFIPSGDYTTISVTPFLQPPTNAPQ